MLHKDVQKRIYFDGAEYFVTFNTQNRIRYFEEPILCEIFIANLRLAKIFYQFDLYGFVVLFDHVHLLFFPHKAKDLSKIVQFLKRNCSRNINYVLGYSTEEAINKSLLRLSGAPYCSRNIFSLSNLNKLNYNYNFPFNKYSKYKESIKAHYNFLRQLKQQYITKHEGVNDIFQKFKWQKAFQDHYIRDKKDFEQHMKYIYINPIKHNMPDIKNYQYVFTNHQALIDQF